MGPSVDIYETLGDLKGAREMTGLGFALDIEELSHTEIPSLLQFISRLVINCH